MKKQKSVPTRTPVKKTRIRTSKNPEIYLFPFYNVRHISCPEDLENGRKVYIGHAPISAIISLSTDENVRDYLVEAEGKKRRVPTQVHRAIKDTLENHSDNFSVLNSGVTIVARSCDINESQKRLELTRPSIINGSQTQGVIKDFFEKHKEEFAEGAFEPHVKFEIIVTDNDELIAEVSIARNFQNDVMTISIAGRLGQLDELEKSFQGERPGTKLKKSETKLSEDYIKTERLLQVITALIPEELWPKAGEMKKVYSYSQKTKCLRDFQEVYRKAKDLSDPEHKKYRRLYQFYLDIAAQAYDLYETWKSHQGFAGTRLRSIERDGREIKSVPDGIVFPILASLSAFAKETDDGWKIDPPSAFTEEELVKSAKSVYMDVANSNPNTMGKSKACYSSLYQITSIYKKLAQQQ
jgi:hypothetical protein